MLILRLLFYVYHGIYVLAELVQKGVFGSLVLKDDSQHRCTISGGQEKKFPAWFDTESLSFI